MPSLRTLIRKEGWTKVDLISPRIEQDPLMKTLPRFVELNDWCKSSLPPGEWHAIQMVGGSTYTRHRIWRFVFKDEKWAAWFKLAHSV